jgi:hypothetical protein
MRKDLSGYTYHLITENYCLPSDPVGAMTRLQIADSSEQNISLKITRHGD